MSESNTLFIDASRQKVRISTSHGFLQVEDLWDLSLQSLDAIAIALDEAIAKQARKSFINARPKEAKTVQLTFDVVKYVIDTKLAEQEAEKVQANRASQIAFLKGLQEKKQLAELEGMSSDEIAAKLKELGVED
jgi:bifunctional N-acetylglucosamine-1-phosphate-uridyltransferase/glucosamine-1-phosphate-acetyltransferase GlmU-like protein